MLAVAVDAFEAVRAKEVTLRLKQIGGAARAAESVEMTERG